MKATRDDMSFDVVSFGGFPQPDFYRTKMAAGDNSDRIGGNRKIVELDSSPSF